MAVALGVMMVALDGTVVSVANPTIQRDLHASLAGLQWVTNGYLLALAVLLIPGGKLGDRLGRRRVFAIGIAGFALASLGCALSSSIGMLVAFRVIRGIAGGLQTTANQLGGVLGTSVLGSILVSSVGSVLASELAAAGVSGRTAQTVLAQKDIVGSGIAPVSAQMSPHLQQAVTAASDAAFLQGLHVAMVVAGGLAIAGALVGLLVRRGAPVDPVHAAAV